ncbi:hypothetical protein BDZ45DRAFT_222534 [Acephala macrosclerotiorum]|nr:hypothetical protein BDZ45DRAFT_222534 [Acephala macrosclerotiorum]
MHVSLQLMSTIADHIRSSSSGASRTSYKSFHLIMPCTYSLISMSYAGLFCLFGQLNFLLLLETKLLSRTVLWLRVLDATIIVPCPPLSSPTYCTVDCSPLEYEGSGGKRVLLSPRYPHHPTNHSPMRR